MIRNIVFDIGEVIIQVSNDILKELFNRSDTEIKEISRIVYANKRWNDCLLGNLSQREYMTEIIRDFPKYKKDIEVLLSIEFQEKVLLLKNDTWDVMNELKNQGYKIYFLSNLTEETYNYLNDKLDMFDRFDGGVFSWMEHLIKPDEKIYKVLLDRYKLNREETVFFDDTLKNIKMANKLGINGVQFRTVDDIINAIKGE